MPKETLNKKPVSLPEVVSIFNKRKKDGELNYLQRIALDHAKSSAQLTGKQATSLKKELTTKYELSEAIAINIVNFMPDTIDELRIYVQDAARVYSTEELENILNLLVEKKS
ncbi:MAG: RNA polymerase Rpb4 family protein [Candidatus Heimdallarchaeota archaeon]